MKRLLTYLTAVLVLLGSSSLMFAQEDASAATLYNSGLEKLKAKQYSEALPLFEQALQAADPEADANVVKLCKSNGSIAAYYVGNDLRKEKKFDEALETYNKGIEMNAGFYANYIGRAQALEDKGELVESIKAYLKAGEMSEKGNKADRAAQMYSKAENFAALAWGEKNWDNTITYAQTFLESRQTAEANFYLGDALKEKKQNDQALEHANKALELAGEADDSSKYHMLKAEIFESMGQKENATEAYKMVKAGKYYDRAQYKVKELSGNN